MIPDIFDRGIPEVSRTDFNFLVERINFVEELDDDKWSTIACLVDEVTFLRSQIKKLVEYMQVITKFSIKTYKESRRPSLVKESEIAELEQLMKNLEIN